MVFLSRFLRASFRFHVPCHSICKRNLRPYTRPFRSDCSHASADPLGTCLEKYKDLRRHLGRRLRAAYARFCSIPDDSAVCGRHHVYFVESDGIYRVDKRQSNVMPVKVLNLGRLPPLKNQPDQDQVEGRHRWTVQRIRLSPREKHLAATVRSGDGEELRCVIVRLGKTNPSNVALSLDKVFSFEWATDDVLFYTTLEALRCSRVFRLSLATAAVETESVHEETRPEAFVEVALSRDQRVLSVNCNSGSSSEVLLVDLATSHLRPRLVQPRQPGLLYHVEHWRGRLIILASTGPGREYQVVQAPLSEPSGDSWVPLFTPGPGTVVKDLDVVGDHCVLVAKTPADGFALIVFPLARPQDVRTVQLPSWACCVTAKRPGLAEQEGVFDFLISSPVHAPVSCRLHPEAGSLAADAPERQDGIATTRLQARGEDGASVPVTLFHALPASELRAAPLLVHVYGAYGQDLSMEFRPESRLLLEQGWALAYCHIRGGGERGLSWHRQAAVERKKTGVDDLRACLRRLFSAGVSCPARTALTAVSAGAVPVGALCNTHPHMMRAVALQAPFLDVLGTMEAAGLPRTLEDREEWGDPVKDPRHRRAIASYCPVHNVTPQQQYPSILLTAYREDARIPLEGVLRYARRLRSAVEASAREPAANIVVNIQAGANHLGPDHFQLMLEQEALKLAFLYAEMGLDAPRPPRSSGRRRRRRS